MKSIAEIKTEMTNAIIENAVLVEALHLDTDKTWAEQTSSASVLNILLYIIAVSWYALQWLFEQFKIDVEERIKAALPGTASWYWNRAMAFQLGDNVNDNGGYDTVDSRKQIVKYCSVVDAYAGVLIKVNAADHAVLDSTQLPAFNAYINKVKFAGVRVFVSSLPPDQLRLRIAVKINPLIMKSDYTTIDGSVDVVRAAIEAYLAGITYGGVFNKTKLTDSIQEVEGVEDVQLINVNTKDETQDNFQLLNTQNYTATAGSIVLASSGAITYTNYQ